MAYTNAEARQELLDVVAAAADRIGVALATLGEAYEQLDDAAADRLEASLFRPVQSAYGRAKRTHAEFAARHGMPPRTFAPQQPGFARGGARGLVELAVGTVAGADGELAALQDSMRPVEVGDAALRSGLQEVRQQLSGVHAGARELLRVLGR